MPSATNDLVWQLTLPVRYALGTVRTALALILVLAYVLVVRIALLTLVRVPSFPR